MKPLPIKQDLFRIVTGPRGIDQISQDEAVNNFIHQPDISKSQLLKTPSSRTKKLKEATSKELSLNSYTELREINPALFDLSTKIQRISDSDELPKEVKALNKEQEIKVWDYLFHDLIERKSIRTRQATINMIKANHLISNLKSKKNTPTQLIAQKLIVPIQIIDLIRATHKEECDGNTIGVDEIGVIDYRRVEQEVCCYVPGEVSHIENILAREFKEKHTRDLVRSELTTESTTEVEIENLSDTSTTTRNELNTEIEKTLENERSQNYGGSLSVNSTYMATTIDANAYADFSNSNSSSVSNSVAKNYAQEIVQKTVEKVVRKTKLKRTAKMIKEFETNNRHGFDNREGTEHVTGIYRWVDVIYTNRLINYGKRLVYKFTIPHPAEFYKMAINFKPKKDGEEQNQNNLKPPETLPEIGVNSASDITRDRYQVFASKYGIQLERPSEQTLTVSKAFSKTVEHKDKEVASEVSDIPIHPDYIATRAKGSWSIDYRARKVGSNWAHFSFIIGGIRGGKSGLQSKDKASYSENFDVSFSHINNIAVSFAFQNCYTYDCSIQVSCTIKPEVFKAWQNKAYSQLKQAYDDKYAEYEQKLNEQRAIELEREEEEKSNPTNPAENRITEQRELKRMAIDMMMRPFCKKLGRDFTSNRDCGDYKVPQTKQTAEYAEYMKCVGFFERAFDWNLMSYVFHPYYWADCKDWVNLIQTKNADRIFQAFLQAGIAEMVVPIKCEMSLAVAYYLETGDIANPGELVPEDLGDKYKSIAIEMEDCHTEIDVEGTWDSRVPTSLTILQKDSALVEEAGLPCCLVEEDGCCYRMKKEGYENTLKPDKDGKYKLLKGKEE